MACRTEGSGSCQQLCPAVARGVPSGELSNVASDKVLQNQAHAALRSTLLESSGDLKMPQQHCPWLSSAAVCVCHPDAGSRAGAERASPEGQEAGKCCRIVDTGAKSASQSSALGCLRLPNMAQSESKFAALTFCFLQKARSGF